MRGSSRNQSQLRFPSEGDLASFRRELLHWFRNNGRIFPWRAKSAGSYVRVISEVLLQRTQAQHVEAFFGRFIEAYPSWRHLAGATEVQLQEFLQPLGLWRRRAVSIVALARQMVRRRGRFPHNRKDLEALPGVGQYIASSILLLCHDQPQPLLDVNMARVLERNFGPRTLADIRHDPDLQAVAAKIVSTGDARDLNWAILDLAALVCLSRKPRCKECPLISQCQFASAQDMGNQTSRRRTEGLTGRC
jgi:A/G-specific adenine glycosylase